MYKKAIIIKDKFGNKLYPATYKDDEGNIIKLSYQQKLISGINIKTVGNESLLGPGNIHITTEYPSFEDLPLIGESSKLYWTQDTNKMYKWVESSEESSYVIVGIDSSYIIGTTAETDHSKFLLDTNASNGLKYWDGSEWVAVPVLFG